jgi:peptidoglycan/LPS O-acetylase OafA/YrhL
LVSLLFGASTPENVEAVHVLTQGWLTDMYERRVYNTETRTGIYGVPGDPGEVIVDIPTDAGLARGYVLPAPIRELSPMTQIHEPVYFFVMHQGLTQTWSLAVEFAFCTALSVMAALLLTVLCKGIWRPGLLLAGLGCLAALTPLWLWLQHATDWLPSSAGMWLPAHLLYFVAGMVLAVLQVLGVRVPLLVACPAAVLGYLIVSAQVAGDVNNGEVTLSQNMLKVALYGAIASSVVAPLVLGGGNGFERLLSAAPVVWLGEISYEIFLLHVITMEIVMASVLHWPLFTGSMPVIFMATLIITIPPAWLLHRWTDQFRALSG